VKIYLAGKRCVEIAAAFFIVREDFLPWVKLSVETGAEQRSLASWLNVTLRHGSTPPYVAAQRRLTSWLNAALRRDTARFGMVSRRNEKCTNYL
jgi:hypothetical protein